MTSAGTHPAPVMLAEFVEGILDDDAASGVASHLEGCPTCQNVVADLRGVPTALRELPAEVPVPEHVSARLSAAIAAEHTRAPEDHADTGHGGEHGTVAWFRRSVPRAVAAAATVAVLGLAGYVAVSGNGGTDQATTADSGAGAGAESLADEPAEEGASAGGEPRAADKNSTEFEALQDESRAELEAATRGVWENRTELSPACGSALADEVGLELIGSDEHGSGVLIVLQDPDSAQLEGRLVSTCGSTTTEALAEPVTVPVP